MANLPNILAVDRAHITQVVTAATGTGETFSNPFIKHPTAVLDDLLSVVAVPVGGTFTALVFNLEQSDNNGASWATAATWDAVANPSSNFQIGETVWYRMNCTTFTPNTATAVNVYASTTGEDILLTTLQTANQVLASPNGASGFLYPRALVPADIPITNAPAVLGKYITAYNSITGVFTQAYSGTQKATLHLNAAALKTLVGSPVAIVPSLGSGFGIHVLSAMIQYVPGLTGFTLPSGGNFSFRYVGDFDSQADIPAAGLIDNTTASIYQVFAVSPYTDVTSVINGIGLEVINDSGVDWTMGDGDVYITFLYELIVLN